MRDRDTIVAYFQDTGPSSERMEEKPTYRASESKELSTITSNISEGDYLAIAYQGEDGAIYRYCGHISDISRLDGRFDAGYIQLDEEESARNTAEDTGYFHLNPSTGDYYFSDGDTVDDSGWRIEKIAWTPK